MQLWASQQFSMRYSVDTAFYLEGADQLLEGNLPKGRAVLYSSYILLLAAIKWLGLPIQSIILLHLVAEILALLAVYLLAKKHSRNDYLPFLASLLCVFWFKFQQWNLIIYTDALFSYMVVITLCAYMLARRNWHKAVVFLLLVFTVFLRPTGTGILFAIAILIMTKMATSTKYKLNAKVGLSLTVLVTFLFLLNEALGYFVDSMIKSHASAEIIYPQIQVLVKAPTDLYLPDDQYSPLIRLLLFMGHNPLYFSQLAATKGLMFLGHMKPYYSAFHNIFIAVFLYPVYLLGLKGILIWKGGSIKTLMMAFIVFQLVTVCLTNENWGGRFLLPILPLVFVLAALGFQAFLNGKRGHQKG